MTVKPVSKYCLVITIEIEIIVMIFFVRIAQPLRDDDSAVGYKSSFKLIKSK